MKRFCLMLLCLLLLGCAHDFTAIDPDEYRAVRVTDVPTEQPTPDGSRGTMRSPRKDRKRKKKQKLTVSPTGSRPGNPAKSRTVNPTRNRPGSLTKSRTVNPTPAKTSPQSSDSYTYIKSTEWTGQRQYR